MKLIHYVPGLPWMKPLDDICSCCHDITKGRFPCTLSVACVWFYILSEARVVAGQGVEYLKTLYKPKKAMIGEYWSRWEIRLGLCAMTFGMSHVLTFHLPPLFRLHWVEDEDGNVRLSRSAEEATGKERMLVSELLVKSISYQSETIVWILGTLLNMPRKRFLPLYVASKLFAPIADRTADVSGNFALWLATGLTLSKLFRLNPPKESRIGNVGTTVALVFSSLHGVKTGRTEIALSLSTAILSELTWRHYVVKRYRAWKKRLTFSSSSTKSDDGKKKKDDEYQPDTNEETKEKKKNIFQKYWNYIMTDDDVKKKKDVGFDAWPALERPSMPVWLGLTAGWIGLGFALDGTGFASP